MTRYWDIVQELTKDMPAVNSKVEPKVQNWWTRLTKGVAVEPFDPQDMYNIDAGLLAAMQVPGNRLSGTVSAWPKTVHCIGSLGAGGAERQLVNLLTALVKRGHDKQTLLTTYPLEGSGNHYGALLSDQDIEIRTNNMPIRDEGVAFIKKNLHIAQLINQLPDAYQRWTMDIWVELSLIKPDVVHCWLDHSNIWSAPAALLAGVPAVMLSTRNVHPENFPYLYAPYMRSTYKWLAKCPRVHFINNSGAGAESYASWIDVPKEKFKVTVNGVDLANLQAATPAERKIIRKELRIPQKAPVIVGAFRLSEEKRPMLFVDLIAQALQYFPNLHAVLMGEGPLLPSVVARAKEHGISKRLHVIGRREDPAKVMSSMDMLLHTAWWEGTPNVVLEAQQLQLPVVVTTGGGSNYAVNDGQSGFLVDRSDITAIGNAVYDILQNLEQWRKKAKSGPKFVADKFAIDRMVDETLACQRKALSAANKR